MDTWERINESVHILAKAQDIPVPANFLVARGTPWERERQQRRALLAFLSKLQLEVKANATIEECADELDEMALKRIPGAKRVLKAKKTLPKEPPAEPQAAIWPEKKRKRPKFSFTPDLTPDPSPKGRGEDHEDA